MLLRDQGQEYGEAEVIVLHDRVARLHRLPEIHPLIDDKEVSEFVHGGDHQAGNNA